MELQLSSKKNQLPLKSLHVLPQSETRRDSIESNGIVVHVSSSIVHTESLDKKTPECAISELTPRKILDKISEYCMRYDIDCRGCCEMPLILQMFALKVTDTEIPLNHELFRCRTSVTSICDPTSIPVSTITSPFIEGKVGNETSFFKLKSGVYSKDWCASEDKVDVYYVEGSSETYIGFITRNVTICGYAWNVMTPTEELMYTIANPSCSLSAFCRFPCGKCDQISFIMKSQRKLVTPEGVMDKKWVCCWAKESDASNFRIKFPEGSDWIEKALLMSACAWIQRDQFFKYTCVL